MQKMGLHVQYPSDVAGGDHFLCEDGCRYVPPGEGHHILHVGMFHLAAHQARLVQCACERLFAQHGFAGACRGHGGSRVRVVRCGDEHGIHLWARDQLLQIIRAQCGVIALGHTPRTFCIRATDSAQLRRLCERDTGNMDSFRP